MVVIIYLELYTRCLAFSIFVWYRSCYYYFTFIYI